MNPLPRMRWSTMVNVALGCIAGGIFLYLLSMGAQYVARMM